MSQRLLLLNPPTDRRVERQHRTGLSLPAFAKSIRMRAIDYSKWERHEIELSADRIAAIEDGLRRLEVTR